MARISSAIHFWSTCNQQLINKSTLKKPNENVTLSTIKTKEWENAINLITPKTRCIIVNLSTNVKLDDLFDWLRNPLNCCQFLSLYSSFATHSNDMDNNIISNFKLIQCYSCTLNFSKIPAVNFIKPKGIVQNRRREKRREKRCHRENMRMHSI